MIKRLKELKEKEDLSPEENYERMILSRLSNHYDDLADLMNMQKALAAVQVWIADKAIEIYTP